MSITIFQSASIFDLTNSDMLWVVTSSKQSESQFQYICAVKDATGSLLTTVKQQPNPYGKGVYDLGRIVKQYSNYTTDQTMFAAGVDSLYYTIDNGRYFQIAFGEEYSTSSTGSVVQYNGISNTPGTASQVGETPLYFFINGTLDPNYGSWNLNYSPNYYAPRISPTNNTFAYTVALTDSSRTQYCQSTDYHTITVFNGNVSASFASTGVVQDIYYIEFKIYSGSTLVATVGEYNVFNPAYGKNTGGPRTAANENWAFLPDNPFTGSLLSIGIGPANITNTGNYDLFTQPWTYYTATIYNQSSTFPSAPAPNYNGIYDQFTIYKQEQPCGFEKTRFAWINNLGTFDWFNFTLATNTTLNLTRNTYKQSFVDYSTPQTTVPYTQTRRGQTSFNIDVDKTYTVYSDWLTQEQADWLEQLFYSPVVYIQDGFKMLPIVLENTEVTMKTNPKSQKLFNYEVTYKLANSLRSR